MISMFRRTIVAAAIVLAGSVGAHAVPVNDLIDGARELRGTSGTIRGNTRRATVDIGTPFAGTSINAPGVWFTFTGGGAQAVLTTDTQRTNYDTKLSVYRGFTGSLRGLSAVTGNDDASICIFSPLCSTVQFNALRGETYHVLVHGFGGQTGRFGLTYNVPDAAPVPLPAAGWMLLAGIGGLAGYRRMRRRG